MSEPKDSSLNPDVKELDRAIPEPAGPEGPSPTPLIDENELAIHRLYRERINQEDNLINHCMMWMILSQGFMFALWGVLSHTEDFKYYDPSVLAYILDATGLFFAICSGAAIAAARAEIAGLQKTYLKFYPADGVARSGANMFTKFLVQNSPRSSILPGLVGEGYLHLIGHSVDYLLPAWLACLWAVLAFRQVGWF